MALVVLSRHHRYTAFPLSVSPPLASPFTHVTRILSSVHAGIELSTASRETRLNRLSFPGECTRYCQVKEARRLRQQRLHFDHSPHTVAAGFVEAIFEKYSDYGE